MKLLTAVLLAVGAAAGPAFTQETWFDTQHGWATDGVDVYGTDTGGRSWHRLLRANEQIFGVQRTSVDAGYVFAYRHTFITIDEGKHWYFADGPDLGNALGRGHIVYWAESNRIYQLVGWPPRRLHCHTGWIGLPNTFARQPKRRNICNTPTYVKLRSRTAYVLSNGDPNAEIELAALVPGGVAGFVFSDCGEFCPYVPPTVIVYRNGDAIVRQLPAPTTTPSDGRVSMHVEWPRIVAIAAVGYWVSDDGGDTWRYVGR